MLVSRERGSIEKQTTLYKPVTRNVTFPVNAELFNIVGK